MQTAHITDTSPKSRQIAKLLTNEIHSGHLKPGESIYSLRSLAKRFNVSYSVINSAYKILKDNNLAVCEQGRGTFVKDDFEKKEPSSASSIATPKAESSSPMKGCDFTLLTSYKQDYVDHYFEAQMEAMNKLNSLCFTCHVNDKNELYLSEKQMAQLQLLNPRILLVDSDGTDAELKQIEMLRDKFNLIYFNRWHWLDEARGPAVLNDYFDGCYKAGEYLESKNCERMAVIGFHDEWRDFHYKAACVSGKGFGLKSTSNDFETFYCGNLHSEFEKIKHFFSPEVKTGIFGLSDYNVVRFIEKIEAILDYKPNVELIGYYDTRWSNRPGVEFSSVKINYNSLWDNIAKFTALDNTDDDTVIWVKPTIINR